MRVEKKGKRTRAIIVVDVSDSGFWTINGDPCGENALAATRLVVECLDSLNRERVKFADQAA
jgi:hypothetical protein